MANETPANFNWTEKRAEEARSQHKYIKYGTGNKLAIGHAKSYWKKPDNEDVVYLIEYRVAAHRADARVFLAERGVREKDIDNILAKHAFTRENVEGDMKAAFEAEVAAQQAARKGEGEQPTVRLDLLGDINKQIIAKIREEREQKKNKAGNAAAKKPGKPRNGGTKSKQTLLERLQSLPDGKVLDVSSISPTGGNVREINKPPASAGKVQPAGLPVVSTTREAFERAMNLLGPDHEQYVAEYDAAKAEFDKKPASTPATTNKAPNAAPKATPAASAAKTPAKPANPPAKAAVTPTKSAAAPAATNKAATPAKPKAAVTASPAKGAGKTPTKK